MVCIRETRKVYNCFVYRINKGTAVEPAKKVFMSTDMLGQGYLCYLLQPSRKLMVARLNYSNDKDPETLIGPATTISAVDASPLPVIMQCFSQNKKYEIV